MNKTDLLGVAFAATIFTTGLGCTPAPIVLNGWADIDGDGFGDPNAALGVVEAYSAGVVGNSTDCNDNDAAIKPGADEIFDEIDNNCDGIVDNVPSWYADNDADGYGNPEQSLQQAQQPSGYLADNTDCDDNNALINPGALEIGGDAIDSNCNGLIDDVSAGTIGPAGGIVFHVEDTFALEAATSDQGQIQWGCTSINIKGSKNKTIGSGDQNTADMAASGCSFVGNDIANLERDGFDDWHLPSIEALKKIYEQRNVIGNFAETGRFPVCYWSSTHRGYSDQAQSIYWNGFGVQAPGSIVDLNKIGYCHIRAVRTVHFEWFIDTDSDGFGDSATKIIQIGQPEGYVSNDQDCNDNNAAINPDASEAADGIDNDCDGPIDELYDIGDTGPAGGTVFYVDASGQHGLEAAPEDQDKDLEFGYGAEWGCLRTLIDGADGEAIGTGAQNTADMLAAACPLFDEENALAVDLVSAYNLNGFDDWFIPSIDELQALYNAKDHIPGFSSYAYWSSTESILRLREGKEPEGHSRFIVFFHDRQPDVVGLLLNKWKGSSNVGVRAVRAF